MGAFVSGFLLGRLLFTPFVLRLLAVAALFGLAAQARYGMHERFMYWLTYRQIHHDHSAFVRLVDAGEPWISWLTGVLYAGVVVLALVLTVRVIKALPVLFQIVLAGLAEAAYALKDLVVRGVAALPQLLDPLVNPAPYVTLRDPGRPEILDPLPHSSASLLRPARHRSAPRQTLPNRPSQ